MSPFRWEFLTVILRPCAVGRALRTVSGTASLSGARRTSQRRLARVRVAASAVHRMVKRWESDGKRRSPGLGTGEVWRGPRLGARWDRGFRVELHPLREEAGRPLGMGMPERGGRLAVRAVDLAGADGGSAGGWGAALLAGTAGRDVPQGQGLVGPADDDQGHEQGRREGQQGQPDADHPSPGRLSSLVGTSDDCASCREHRLDHSSDSDPEVTGFFMVPSNSYF